MSSNTAQEQAPPGPIFRATWTRRLIVSLTILTIIVIAMLVLYALALVSNALIVLLISALLAYMMYPLVRLLERRLPRPLAITIAYLVIVAILGAFLYFVTSSILRQSSSSIQALQSLFSPQGQRRLQPILDFLYQFGISQQQIDFYRNQLLSQAQGFIMGVIPFLTGFFSNIITLIIIITLSVYFIIDGSRLVGWLCNRTPISYRDTITFLIHTLDRSIGGYFRGLLLLSSIGAVCTGIVLTLLHVPYATLLALLFFLLFFIPTIGGYVSGALCILAAIPQGWVTVLIVTIFTVLLQQIVLGQIMAPRIFSQSVGLHPIVALFALLAGGQLFGILGGFFSVPLAGVIQEVITSYWKRWEHNHPQKFQAQVTPAEQPTSEKLDHIPTQSSGI